MTQLDNAQPAPTPVDQGADPAVMPTGGTANPASTVPEMWQVPGGLREQYGGDHHALSADAKMGREYKQDGTFAALQELSLQYGASVQDLLGWIKNAQDQEPPVVAPPVPLAEAPPAGDIFDPVKFRADILGDFQETLKKDRDDATTATTQAEQLRLYNEAIAAEDTARQQFLEARSLARPEDGSRSPKFNAANSLFWENVMDAKRAMIPAHVVDPQQRQAYLNQPASAAMLAGVAEQTGNDLKDLMAEGAAAFATKQEPTAGVSLDYGPGATTPTPDGDKMTTEQEKAFVTDGMLDDED